MERLEKLFDLPLLTPLGGGRMEVQMKLEYKSLYFYPDVLSIGEGYHDAIEEQANVLINEMAADGWEYTNNVTLGSLNRSLLVFKREC